MIPPAPPPSSARRSRASALGPQRQTEPRSGEGGVGGACPPVPHAVEKHPLGLSWNANWYKTIPGSTSGAFLQGRLGYAQKHLSTSPKDAVISCEGMCLKGETARRAANLIAHKLVPDKAVRICHGCLLEEGGGMRDLVERATGSWSWMGAKWLCGTRLTKGASRASNPGWCSQTSFSNATKTFSE